jgi:hypothetical protein|tara:strand:+ start:1908 stop:2075 length:168 start_codon:yes stop_codon:yes gene_type:complete
MSNGRYPTQSANEEFFTTLYPDGEKNVRAILYSGRSTLIFSITGLHCSNSPNEEQ